MAGSIPRRNMRAITMTASDRKHSSMWRATRERNIPPATSVSALNECSSRPGPGICCEGRSASSGLNSPTVGKIRKNAQSNISTCWSAYEDGRRVPAGSPSSIASACVFMARDLWRPAAAAAGACGGAPMALEATAAAPCPAVGRTGKEGESINDASADDGDAHAADSDASSPTDADADSYADADSDADAEVNTPPSPKLYSSSSIRSSRQDGCTEDCDKGPIGTCGCPATAPGDTGAKHRRRSGFGVAVATAGTRGKQVRPGANVCMDATADAGCSIPYVLSSSSARSCAFSPVRCAFSSRSTSLSFCILSSVLRT
eukprot:Opistho-2@7669